MNAASRTEQPSENAPRAPMTIEQLIDSARAAGVEGESFQRWCDRSEIFESIGALDVPTLRTAGDRCQAAYTEGRTSTWMIRWTDAHPAYDTFGTRSLESHEWGGKILRKVAIDPAHLDYQCSRYGSGLHCVWGRDPREEERERNERIARERIEREARETKRATGLETLRQLTNDDLDAIGEDDPARDGFVRYETLGVTSHDVQVERSHRQDAIEEADRAARWAKCRAMVPDGCVLVCDATPGERGQFGWIPGRESRVYFGIKVIETRGTRPDPDGCPVWDSKHARGAADLGSLAIVCADVERGVLRVASPADVPPEKVLDRIGHDQLAKIQRIEVPANEQGTGVKVGRTVWIGRPRFADGSLCLDANGRKVTHKATLRYAYEAAARSREGKVAP